MRAALSELWPALSECFGIYPRDVKWLSIPEIASYIEQLPAALARKQQINLTAG